MVSSEVGVSHTGDADNELSNSICNDDAANDDLEEQLVECNHVKERSCAILESDGLEMIFLNRPKPPLDQADHQPILADVSQGLTSDNDIP
ncbi:hypothetical protein GH714_030878 [Hevea brasiliensis]|uniref:Uncharacterized protein n=1 Tax=Hevea brasiliensis TaxID=3981 RepID=A0A6A6LKJ9_HEVBR|nr:hypothetical protein GH714_030878 [Hevea brasiliensis]